MGVLFYHANSQDVVLLEWIRYIILGLMFS